MLIDQCERRGTRCWRRPKVAVARARSCIRPPGSRYRSWMSSAACSSRARLSSAMLASTVSRDCSPIRPRYETLTDRMVGL